jgi:phytoene dehydrogenase-like protein
MEQVDAVVVGGGHNGLTCAAYLAGAGRSVLVLERDDVLGGAARSEQLFPGFDARLSSYSYLVSLLPQQIVDELQLDVTLQRRRYGSFTPTADGGILVDGGDRGRTRRQLGPDADPWDEWAAMTGAVAARVFPTLTEPLRDGETFRRVVDDDVAWRELFERPIGEALEARFVGDAVRGTLLTDGLIGTFAHAHELAANRCFLYHVIGRGSGHWDVPVGGMGAVSDELARAARQRGAALRTGAEVRAIRTNGRRATVQIADGSTVEAQHVFANVAPRLLADLLGEPESAEPPEGAQVKVNLLLARLPAVRDTDVTPEQAFTGTFHVNEGYAQLERAYRQAATGTIPDVVPCEVYCHSLSDPTILGPDLRAAGAQTMTVFALHLPTRLFAADPAVRLEEAGEAVLASLDSVLAEPIRDCLLAPECIEVVGPREVEQRLGMPGGNIFHRELQWPFAEDRDEVGRWGTETTHPNVFVCGAGARRGGGVSGIPGRNAAMAALGEWRFGR